MKNIKLFPLVLTFAFSALLTFQVSAQLDNIPNPDKELDRVVDKLEKLHYDMDDANLKDLKEGKEENDVLIDLVDKFDTMDERVVEEIDKINEVKEINIWDHSENITLEELRYIEEELVTINEKGEELAELDKKAVEMAEELADRYEDIGSNSYNQNPRGSESENADGKNPDTKEIDVREEREYLNNLSKDLDELMDRAEPIRADINGSSRKILEMIKR